MEIFTSICLWVDFEQLSTHLQRKESFKVVNTFLDWTTHPISFFMWLWYQSTSMSREKAMAPHSSTLAWKIPWTEEPGGLQSMGSLRVRHDWATSLWLFTFMHWRRKWQPTPVFLPGESQGRGEPGGLPSMGSHRVRHDWRDLAVAAAAVCPSCVLL